MKLVFINGSPRGKSSNTALLLDRFLSGFQSVDKEIRVDYFYLKKKGQAEQAVQALNQADIAIIAFPLYTDAMPGIVKELFEVLHPDSFRNTRLKLGFIVQSGFPESHHSTFVERYLVKLARRMGIDYLGTMIKGGVEGIQIQPRWMTRYLDLFYEQGQYLALEWEFSREIIQKLKNPDRMRGFRLLLFRLLRKAGLSNYYWNMQLKKNNAFEHRYAKPYTNQ
jgi:NAD(P)H-dependent FMN reductase